MPAEPKTVSWPAISRWLLPLLVSLAALLIVFQQVDLAQFSAALQRISAGRMLLASGLFIAGLLLRAFSWKLMLGSAFSFGTAFAGLNAGYLLNNILPFRLGDVGRALLLTGDGKQQRPFGEVFATIITERVLDVFIGSVFLLLSVRWLSDQPALRTAALAGVLLMCLVMLLAGLAARHQQQVIDFLKRKLPAKPFWQTRVLHFLDETLTGFHFFTQPARWIPAALLLIFSWGFSMIQLGVLQQDVLNSSSWFWPMLVVSAGAFINALPSAPAGMGVFEAAVVGAYALLGVANGPALALGLALHAFQFIIPSLFGTVGLVALNKNPGQFLSRVWNRAPKPGGSQ